MAFVALHSSFCLKTAREQRTRFGSCGAVPVFTQGCSTFRKASSLLGLRALAGSGQHDTNRSQGEIDFAKLNFAEGNELSGMVFKPDAELAKAGPDDSRARLAFSSACEEAINNQINVEFTASYAYYALHAYFDRDTVALPGFASFFLKQAEEEREHALKLMHYQNKRGGRVHLKPIAVPAMHFQSGENADAVYAMELALQLEKFVQLKLLEVWKVADREGDANMADFVEDYLSMQVESIKEIADYVAQLKRVGTGHGIYHFDRVLGEQ
jgi:ferritin heavy chain